MDRKMLSILGAVFIVSASFFYGQGESVYPKLTRFELLYKKIVYSAQNEVAAALFFKGTKQFYLKAPYYKQEHPVTCEVASLRMALGHHGSHVSELELINELTFDIRGPMWPNGIWGDPDKGFVGDVNGSIFKRTGYGVYDKPILDLAVKYRQAGILNNADLESLLTEVVRGNPVIVWGLISRRDPVYWTNREGKTIEAHPGEHARVLIGYVGDINNPTKLLLLDPIFGRIRMDKDKFLAEWRVMENRAVVVYKELSRI